MYFFINHKTNEIVMFSIFRLPFFKQKQNQNIIDYDFKSSTITDDKTANAITEKTVDTSTSKIQYQDNNDTDAESEIQDDQEIKLEENSEIKTWTNNRNAKLKNIRTGNKCDIILTLTIVNILI